MNYQRLFRDEIPIFDAGTILSNRNFVDTWSCSRVVRGVRANADVDVGGGGFGGGFDVVGVVGDGGGGGQRRRQRQAIRAGPTQSALRPAPEDAGGGGGGGGGGQTKRGARRRRRRRRQCRRRSSGAGFGVPRLLRAQHAQRQPALYGYQKPTLQFAHQVSSIRPLRCM